MPESSLLRRRSWARQPQQGPWDVPSSVAAFFGALAGCLVAWAVFAWAARRAVEQVVVLALLAGISWAMSAGLLEVQLSPTAAWRDLRCRMFQRKASADDEDESAWDGDDDCTPAAAKRKGSAKRRSGRGRSPSILTATMASSTDGEALSASEVADPKHSARRRRRPSSQEGDPVVDGVAATIGSPPVVACDVEDSVAATEAVDAALPVSDSTTASSCRDSEEGEVPLPRTAYRSAAPAPWVWQKEGDDYDDDWDFGDEDDESVSIRRSWSEGDLAEYALCMTDQDPDAEHLASGTGRVPRVTKVRSTSLDLEGKWTTVSSRS